jgi:hypothetical protein
MKNLKTLAAVVAGSLVVCGLAIAQSGNASGHDSQHSDPAALAAHLAQFFPKIAAFDADKNGKLDDMEKESLRKAIADGTIELPAHAGPHGEKPSAEMMVNHICEVYPQVARYDANHDGMLDETEQAALKKAIEKGELDFAHGEQSKAAVGGHQ